MLPTNDVTVFFRENHVELQKIVASICRKFHFTHFSYNEIQDIVQDIYVKIIHGLNYDENRNTKISTLVYRIAWNHIRSLMMNNEHKIVRCHCPNTDDPIDSHGDEIDTILRYNSISTLYQNHLQSNEAQDPAGGLNADLDDFSSRYLDESRNHYYPFNRRKNKEAPRIGCTMREIMDLFREGYDVGEIAEIYGVTNMSIHNVKSKISEALRSYGLEPFSKAPQKQPTDDLTLLQQVEMARNLYVLGWSAKNISERMGRSVPYVYLLLKISSAPKHVRDSVEDGTLNLYQAKKMVDTHKVPREMLDNLRAEIE